MKKVLTVLGVFVLVACNTNNKQVGSNNSSNDSLSLLDTVVIDTARVEPIGNTWVYDESTDPMTDKKIYFASIEADELLYFDAPYDGGITTKLVLRKKPSNFDIFIKISTGQFYSSNYDNKTIKARFDSLPAQTYSYSEASDASSDVIFINSTTKFLQNLKKAKKLILQCEFYNEGTRTITFNVDKLKWEH